MHKPSHMHVCIQHTPWADDTHMVLLLPSKQLATGAVVLTVLMLVVRLALGKAAPPLANSVTSARASTSGLLVEIS